MQIIGDSECSQQNPKTETAAAAVSDVWRAPNAAEAYDRYGKMVYRLAFARTGRSCDADDVLQEVFMRYLRAGDCFNEEEHCKAWLLRATINCCGTLMTSAWIRRIAPMRDNLRTHMREKSEVYYAVMALPTNFRTAIHLHYYEHYTIAETAQLMSRPEATVKTWLQRARNRLRDLLRGEEFDV